MASNSYYGSGDGQQQGYGQQSTVPYGQSSYGNDGQGQGQQYGGYGGQGQYQGQQQGGQTFAEQTYPDGSREQKYDAQGNPVLPNGERGLLGDLAGAAGGAFLGHKAGHGFLGAIAGGIGAHLVGDAMEQKQHRPPGYQGQGGGGGVFGGMFGRRDIDGNPGGPGGYEGQGGPQNGYGQVDYQQQQQHGQQGGYGQEQYGQGRPNDGNYGQNYGQNYGGQ